MNFDSGDPHQDVCIATNLDRMTEDNQETALRYLRLRRLDCKPGTLYNYSLLLRLLDDNLNGRPFESATVEDVQDFLFGEKKRVGTASVVMRTRLLKRFLKDSRGKLPDDLQNVLRTKEPPPPDRANIVDAGQFGALLEACNSLRRFRTVDRVALAQAFLWFLWDTGFRVGEALAVRVCDLKFTSDSVIVRLSTDSPYGTLKTGPRTIEVNECVPALKAWMGLHPDPRPEAPVWITIHREIKAMSGQACDNLVKLIWKRSGVSLHGSKPLSCHDLRHTSATRRAEAGWVEADLRKFHGWTWDSMMPARYVHKAMLDVRALVRRDAGLDPDGGLAPQALGAKHCPYCAERIAAAAIKCKHCQTWLQEPKGARVEAEWSP